MNALVAAASGGDQNFFQKLLEASISVGKYQLHWLEFIGILIGIVSAYFGMKRWVWAWPVGITANIMLFFVYIGAAIGTDTRVPLFGQAGRQVFFILTSIYGWWRWSQHRKRRHADLDEPAVTPRWATNKERLALAAIWLVGTVIAQFAFQELTAWPAEWWYHWCDAWIFVGSFVATYAMARAWNEFWLAWIAVDLVGVPLGFATDYVPTAVMYIFYGMFVLYGFSQWVKVTRKERAEQPEPVAV